MTNGAASATTTIAASDKITIPTVAAIFRARLVWLSVLVVTAPVTLLAIPVQAPKPIKANMGALVQQPRPPFRQTLGEFG